MASTNVETVTTGADKLRLSLAGLLLVAGAVAFYFLAGRGALLQWAGLLSGLVLAALVFFTGGVGQRLVLFSRDAWRETQKVVWPGRKEAIQTTAFVVAFTIAMALVLWMADKLLDFTLYDLILGWRR